MSNFDWLKSLPIPPQEGTPPVPASAPPPAAASVPVPLLPIPGQAPAPAPVPAAGSPLAGLFGALSGVSADQEILTTRIDRIVHRADNWYVLSLPDGSKAVGSTENPLVEDLPVRLTGKWQNDPRFGKQFKFSELDIRIEENDQDAMVALLQLVKGVGKAKARQIVEFFPDNLRHVILEDPDQIRKVPGCGANLVASIRNENAMLRSHLETFEEFGHYIERGVLTKLHVQKIVRRFNKDAMRVLQDQPYRIADIRGIGFMTADRVAQQIAGLLPYDRMRLQSALLYQVSKFTQEGSTCLPQQQLINRTVADLVHSDEKQSGETITNKGPYYQAANVALQDLVSSERLILHVRSGTIYRPSVWKREEWIVQDLLKREADNLFTDSQINDLVDRLDPELTVEQRQAVVAAFTSPITLITGFPGTGKTRLVRAICRIADHLREELENGVCLCSPTGKAAKRLAEATGREAGTVHRTLEVKPKTLEGDDQEVSEDEEDSYGNLTWNRNRKNPLDADIVLADEATMEDLFLFRKHLDAVHPKTRLVLVGDVDQLPSVGSGKVFDDLIRSQQLPVQRLTQIHRQKQGSSICLACAAVRAGQDKGWPFDEELVFVPHEDPDTLAQRLVDLSLVELHNGVSLDELQILVPQNRRSSLTAPIVNYRFQMMFASKPPPIAGPYNRDYSVNVGRCEIPIRLSNHIPSQIRLFEGDRVRHTKNNYRLEVFNGEIGEVVNIDRRQRLVEVQYPDRDDPVEYVGKDVNELTPAFAMTVHSAQGSEWSTVLIGVHKTNAKMLTRNWLYTAMSRAKSRCILVGTQEAITHAVNNVTADPRCTRLAERLAEARR